MVSQLRHQPQVRLLGDADIDQATVAVVICEAFDESTRRVVQALRRGDSPKIVLVASLIDDGTVVAAAECGVGGLLRRCDATVDGLVRTVVRVAAGDGEVPPDLLGRHLEYAYGLVTRSEAIRAGQRETRPLDELIVRAGNHP